MEGVCLVSFLYHKIRQEGEALRIHILQTNDVHSHFEEFLQLATQLRTVRAQINGESEVSYLFDIGDHADRVRLETDGTAGLVNVAMLSALQYDAWVLGNNEGLTLVPDQWEKLTQAASFPVIVSNLVRLEDGSSYPFFQNMLMFTRGRVKVGVFSLTATFNDFYHLLGAHADDPVSCIEKYVPTLRQQGADIIILMSHLGITQDRALAEQFQTVNGVKGIDVILGSHTHHVLQEPEQIGQTWLTGAGKYAEYLGHVTVDYDTENKRIQSVQGRLYERDPNGPVDVEMQEILEYYGSRAAESLDEPIASLQADIIQPETGESILANLIADEMRRLTGSPIGILNTGTISTGLQRGAVTRGDLLRCSPSPINPVVVRFTGEQIIGMLQKALLPAYYARKGRGFGFRGDRVGTLAASGMSIYTHDNRIFHVEVNGTPLERERGYEVATIDYLWFSGVYEEASLGERIRFELPLLRELLELALKNPAHLEEAEIPRWLEVKNSSS